MPLVGSFLYVAVLWMAVLVASLISATFTEAGQLVAGDFAAWILNTVLTLALVSLPPVRAFLERLPPVRAAITGALFFCVALGAVAPGIPRAANFPFITWNMFSEAEFYERPVFAEFTAVRPDGSEFPFNPVPAMLALRHARLTVSLENRMATQTEESVGEFADLLEAVGKVYNEQHPDSPIARLDIYITKVDLGDEAFAERDFAFSLSLGDEFLPEAGIPAGSPGGSPE